MCKRQHSCTPHAGSGGTATARQALSLEVRAGISGVAAAAAMTNQSRKREIELQLPVMQHWRQSYKERTKAHTGYFDVDYFSLKESSGVSGHVHRLDSVPWEHRDVKQRFLLEKDIAVNRNWFGKFVTLQF